MGRRQGSITVIYPLSKTDYWDNNEIRYSLRSLQNIDFINKVIIVGEKPEFINDNVIFIKEEDKNVFKDINILRKLFIGTRVVKSDKYLFMSDDQILLNKLSIEDFKNYYDNSLLENYRSRVKNLWKNTGNSMIKEGYKYIFECHCPYIHTRSSIEKAYFEYKRTDKSFLVNTFIYRFNPEINPVKVDNSIIRCLKNRIIYPELIDKSKFLNYNNKGLNKDLKEYIQNKFNEKSVYES